MKSVIVTILAASLAACGGSNLSFSVRSGTTASTVARSGALVAANGIVLSRVRIVISKVELEKAGTVGEMDEVAGGPYLLDLSGPNLDGTNPAKLLDASFTPGTYSEVEFELHKPDGIEHGANADLKDMVAATNPALPTNSSMIVEGTIDGATFTYTTDVNAKQKYQGNLVLKNGSNLTLNVDPTSWFLSGGTRLDPRDPANKATIDNNIKASFKLFKDDSHSGHADPA